MCPAAAAIFHLAPCRLLKRALGRPSIGIVAEALALINYEDEVK